MWFVRTMCLLLVLAGMVGVANADFASVGAQGTMLHVDDTLDGIRLCPTLSPLCESSKSQPVECGSKSDSKGSYAVVMRVENQLMANLELLYVDHAGKEVRYWVIDAQGEFKFNTRPGDLWRMRIKTGDLAFELRVPAAGATQSTIVPSCLPLAQLDTFRATLVYDEPAPDPEVSHWIQPLNPPAVLASQGGTDALPLPIRR